MLGDETDDSVSAYAVLLFERFKFYVQTLELTVGRKAKRGDFVDVHLGPSKAISRKHVKIYYQFDAMSWEIEVQGRNGAYINEQHVGKNCRAALNDADKIMIDDTEFVFHLPDGALTPMNETVLINPFDSLDGPSALSNTTTSQFAISTPFTKLNDLPSTTPIAPRDLMQKKENTKTTLEDQPLAIGTNSSAATLQSSNSSSGIAKAINANSQIGSTNAEAKKVDSIAHQHNFTNSWSVNPSIVGTSTAPKVELARATAESLETQAKTEEERRIKQEEEAAQLKAQAIYQERVARQARKEAEGLALPPAETDPDVIASFQKPTASYATMIYNAITSRKDKKMSLTQIYEWIKGNHPYYRYIDLGWQNSIRHNLSLNKAFMKVSRTDEEPGKGCFWAVDQEAEMLFEGGIYKKKPPRPIQAAPMTRGAPVVMRDGKLALNPNYFANGIQGKAEEVLEMLEDLVRRHMGADSAESEETASQLARILALALATQLRQSAVSSTNTRPQQPLQTMQRPSAPSIAPNTMPRYVPTQIPGPSHPLGPTTAPKIGPASNLVGTPGQTNPVALQSTPRPGSTTTSGTTPIVNRTAAIAALPNPIRPASDGTPVKQHYAIPSSASRPGVTQIPPNYKPYQPYQPANSSLNAALARSQAASAAAASSSGASKPAITPINGSHIVSAGKPVTTLATQSNTGPPSTGSAPTPVATTPSPKPTTNQGSTSNSSVSMPNKPVVSNASTITSATSMPVKTMPNYTAPSILSSLNYKKPSIGPVPGPVTYTRTPLPASTPVVYNRTLPPGSSTSIYKTTVGPHKPVGTKSAANTMTGTTSIAVKAPAPRTGTNMASNAQVNGTKVAPSIGPVTAPRAPVYTPSSTHMNNGSPAQSVAQPVRVGPTVGPTAGQAQAIGARPAAGSAKSPAVAAVKPIAPLVSKPPIVGPPSSINNATLPAQQPANGLLSSPAKEAVPSAGTNTQSKTTFSAAPGVKSSPSQQPAVVPAATQTHFGTANAGAKEPSSVSQIGSNATPGTAKTTQIIESTQSTLSAPATPAPSVSQPVQKLEPAGQSAQSTPMSQAGQTTQLNVNNKRVLDQGSDAALPNAKMQKSSEPRNASSTNPVVVTSGAN